MYVFDDVDYSKDYISNKFQPNVTVVSCLGDTMTYGEEMNYRKLIISEG
jgi:hypothetical protein